MKSTASSGVPRAARNALILLTCINLFNYVDRFIIPGLTVSLKEALRLSDTQIGLLATGLILVYSLSAPVFGELGDRLSRPMLIAAGVAIWSVATVAGGFAWGFVSLLVARAVLGIGEASYAGIAPSILADLYPSTRRGRVFAIFYTAIPIGSALGYITAGVMDRHFGWRSAFFVAGVPGLILSFFLLRLKDPERGRQDRDSTILVPDYARETRAAVYRGLLRNRRYLLTVLGYTAYTFALGALAVWMPSFLTRVRHIPREIAATKTGAIAVFTGLVGTFAGGWLGDRLLKRSRQAYLWLAGAVTLLAVPCTFVVFTAHEPRVFYSALVAAQLLLFSTAAPVNSEINNAVPVHQRATAMALSMTVMHLLGDTLSPTIVGRISDTGRAAGLTDAGALQRAVLILPVALIASGAFWLLGAITTRRRGPPRTDQDDGIGIPAGMISQ